MAKPNTRADDDFLTVEAAAFYTGRSDEMIRRFARENVIKSIRHPEDKRRILIPWSELEVIMNQPRMDPKTKRLVQPRRVVLTMSDGKKRVISTMG